MVVSHLHMVQVFRSNRQVRTENLTILQCQTIAILKKLCNPSQLLRTLGIVVMVVALTGTASVPAADAPHRPNIVM
jgi:hypothetical protein